MVTRSIISTSKFCILKVVVEQKNSSTLSIGLLDVMLFNKTLFTQIPVCRNKMRF